VNGRQRQKPASLRAKAILRTTPVLLGLFFMVTLWATISPNHESSSREPPPGIQKQF
jgi:preprotein translocase subunit SecG